VTARSSCEFPRAAIVFAGIGWWNGVTEDVRPPDLVPGDARASVACALSQSGPLRRPGVIGGRSAARVVSGSARRDELAAPEDSVVLEHLDPERVRPYARHLYDVRPRHRDASERGDPLEFGELAAANLALLEPGIAEIDP